ncbi:MAG: RluA family pseudouridine synthase [Clostridia bacterium]|nr:RluA family pseudouridine synthase [Clostridia bacterium]
MARKIVLTAPGNLRISALLRREISASRALMTELKKDPEGVLCDGRPAFLTAIPQSGSVIEISIPESFEEEGRESSVAPSQTVRSEVVFKNDDFAVLLKPSGMPTHPSRAHVYDTLANDFAALFPGTVYRPITRLDADTSGLVLVALNKAAASIDRKSIERIYYGLTDRPVEPSFGVIDGPIERLEPFSPIRTVKADGKSAVTHYRAVCKINGFTLIRFRLETGRTHQIRVHSSYMGFPLCGDGLYGGSEVLQRQALHAAFIRFTDPITSKRISVGSKLPSDIRALLK